MLDHERPIRISRLVLAFTVMAVLVCLPASIQTQSSAPSRLEDCTPETAAFVAERQEAIQREAAALHDLPEAGVYHADNMGGDEWLLIWAPKAGFIAYYIPDAPCPAHVYYGAVRFDRETLTLYPQIPFDRYMKSVFGEKYTVIIYHKTRFLVLTSRVKAFYKSWHIRDPDLRPPFLGQQPYADSFWRQDPLRPAEQDRRPN